MHALHTELFVVVVVISNYVFCRCMLVLICIISTVSICTSALIIISKTVPAQRCAVASYADIDLSSQRYVHCAGSQRILYMAEAALSYTTLLYDAVPTTLLGL
jgi:hypothetical protein